MTREQAFARAWLRIYAHKWDTIVREDRFAAWLRLWGLAFPREQLRHSWGR